MTLFNDPNKRRELIMKHYSHPINKGDFSSMNTKVDHYSTKCVDKIHLGLQVVDNVIVDAKFEGEGCAVFLSSVDIMLEMIKGKKVLDAKKIISEYEKLINNKPADEELLKELTIYSNVGTHLNRLHCAEMISDALNKII